jgi:AcrR family transcriptional regulator
MVKKKRRYEQRARAEQALLSKKAILAAAVRAFSTQSFDSVSLDAIAARAKVTVQTVLRLFGSKAELFQTSAEEMAKSIASERDAALALGPRAAIASLCRVHEAYGDVTMRIIAQRERVEVIASVLQAGRRYHLAWVRRVFSDHLPKAKALRERKVLLLAALLQVSNHRFLREEGLSAKAAVETLVASAEAILGTTLA